MTVYKIIEPELAREEAKVEELAVLPVGQNQLSPLLENLHTTFSEFTSQESFVKLVDC